MTQPTNPAPTGAEAGNGPEARDTPLRRSILADDVYGVLRDWLLAHRIAPGARLNLDELARQFHVSNTPVRQALARLESEGLVRKEPFRGFTASDLLDSRTIAEIFDYRMILEPTLAARAARRRTTAEALDLEARCDAERGLLLTEDASGSGGPRRS